MATDKPSARQLIEEVRAEGRTTEANIAELRRLKIESDRAYERFHRAVTELVNAQAELSRDWRAPL